MTRRHSSGAEPTVCAINTTACEIFNIGDFAIGKRKILANRKLLQAVGLWSGGHCLLCRHEVDENFPLAFTFRRRWTADVLVAAPICESCVALPDREARIKTAHKQQPVP